jgi:hypothetical protein
VIRHGEAIPKILTATNTDGIDATIVGFSFLFCFLVFMQKFLEEKSDDYKQSFG